MKVQTLLDLTKTSLPIVVVIAICTGIFSLGALYDRFLWQQTDTGSRVDKVEIIIKELREGNAKQDFAISQMADTLLNIQKILEARRFDVNRFCLGLERLNRNFRCPNDL